jgi:uncharacterized iron-regulated protein
VGDAPHHAAPAPAAELAPFDRAALTAFDGETGAPLDWAGMMAAAQAADVVVLAEQHTDAVGHAVQRAVVEALLAAGPAAICLEMLERDEQPLLDAYLAGTISKATFVRTTDSTDWAAKGTWNAWYQPVIDAAKTAGAPVIAANAPRRLASLSRLESFDVLTSLALGYPGQAVVPAPLAQEPYRARFDETMSAHGEGVHALTPEMVEGMFRAQQVWDATMADSVVAAQAAHGKAVLLVGQFHADFEGGTVLRIRAANPDLKICVISVQTVAATALRAEDRGRAAVVVYSGE